MINETKSGKPKGFSQREEDTSLRNSLEDIALKFLINEGFTIHHQDYDIPHNKVVVVYSRDRAEGIAELTGSIIAEIKCTSIIRVPNIQERFRYKLESEMNYFARFPEKHSFRAFAGGTDTTKQQLIDAFRDYVSKVVLGHKQFFDKVAGLK